MIEGVREWVQLHPGLVTGLVGASVVTFIASVLLVPWLLTRVPEDYFAREERKTFARLAHHPVLRALLVLLKNGLGVVLVLAGLLMLLLPGQGILTLTAGVFLLNFPGKYRLEARLIGSPRVFRVVNAIRTRAGKAPLRHPDSEREMAIAKCRSL